jgi:hypothetical protein
LSNAGFLGVLTGFLQYFLYGPIPNDVLAPIRRAIVAHSRIFAMGVPP